MNPNPYVTYSDPLPVALDSTWKKYIIQAATPNDTKLNFNAEDRYLIPKPDSTSYNFSVFNKPNTGNFDENVDIQFDCITTPSFPIWVEKIKICLHKYSTYGCIKLNVWDFGNSLNNTPINLCGVEVGETANENSPLTIYENQSIISNAINSTDYYMTNSGQTPKLSPYSYTISSESILRFGIQYAEGNGYGLKVYLIGWVQECTIES